MNSNSIRFLPLRRREVLRSRTFRATPIALANEERTPHNPGIRLPSLFINDILLILNDGTGLALVIDADDFVVELEFSTGGGGRERLEKGYPALAIKDTAGVEFWDTGNGDCTLGGIEVDYFLCCVLECCGELGGGARRDWVGLRRMMG